MKVSKLLLTLTAVGLIATPVSVASASTVSGNNDSQNSSISVKSEESQLNDLD